MLPPAIFGIRLFSAVNAVTVCVYAAFGGFFFLAVLQLQVVVGYSALAAGTALLPTTVLMLLLSARSGRAGTAYRAAHPAHRRAAAVCRGDAADDCGWAGAPRTSPMCCPRCWCWARGW